MSPAPASDEVTGLLLKWSEGDAKALESLIPVVYKECRGIAARQLRRERPEHTLSPTALVHEFYFRVVDQSRVTWKDRAHFFGVAGHLMRRVLVDYARARQAKKRGGGRTRVSLGPWLAASKESSVADVLAIDEALQRLGRLDPEQERIVEMRFFAGLTVEEIAHALDRSPRTVKREWRLAKAWLHHELSR